MISHFRHPGLALMVTFFLLMFITSPAQAAMLPSQGGVDTAELDTIQRALENKLVIEKLAAHGLSSEEVSSKLKDMTPAQIHLLAQASDDVLAGGDGLGFVIGVLVVIILVIVILKLLGKDIVISKACTASPADSLPVCG